MTGISLGARIDGDGTSFAVFSSVAEAVELCLFDEESRETRVRDPHPGTRLEDSIIYELHVKGFTKLHPHVPERFAARTRGWRNPR
jgi:pullulanase/glycogen debranching enzyme